MSTLRVQGVVAIALAALYAPLVAAWPVAQDTHETMSMLREAVAFQTVQGQGQVPAFARYLAGRLESAGFAKSEIEITPVGETAAMAVHYRGGDATLKPILISGHMDVVAANPKDWQRDPFNLVEENGYLYGRGVFDMKAGVVALVTTFMRLRRESFVPKRSMILVLSGDEEGDMASTRELAKRYHNAEFVLNADGGEGKLDANGKPVIHEIQAAEKAEADFTLAVTSPGGHSSEPDPAKNTIYRLSAALMRIAAHGFPVEYNEITLASLAAEGKLGTGPLAAAMRRFAADPGDADAAAVISADPEHVGQIRTTCIPTMYSAGHATSALPQRAEVNVNCRVFPGTRVASVETTLTEWVNDPAVTITLNPPPPTDSSASLPRQDVLDAVTAAIRARYPGLTVVPVMSSYATDGKHFRAAGIPTFGVAPEFIKPNDGFAHGLDERLPASEIPAALDYWHSLLTRLSQ